jgi:hypothetical protein
VDDPPMEALLSLLLMTASSPPVDHPRTYLASIVDLPLKRGESLESFSFETWGVTFGAVCRIPPGWRIKAGSSATPDGVLEGEGSLGATWFSQTNPKALNGLVLVTLYAPVQKQAIRAGDGEIPATFSGYAMVSTEDGETKLPLTADNIRLTPGNHC